MEREESSLVQPDLEKQLSYDESLHGQRQRKCSDSTKIRRVQSERKRKKSTRTLKVICKVKPKIMYKVTLSSPEKTPSPEIFQQYDIDIKGADYTKLCTPKDFEKSRKVFFNSDPKRAEIIVKEKENVIEHFPFEVLKSQNASSLKCNQMNLTTSAPERTLPDIRLFNNDDDFLCEKEKIFLQKRKVFIHSALKRLLNKENPLVEIHEDVPHIALLGSGGGYRAMVAMSGIFNALNDTCLLDCILYTAVLSGSSWYIATLYSHPDWPCVDPKKVQEKLRTDISKNPKSWKNFFYYGPWYLAKYLKLEKCNLTLDVFAHLLGSCLIGNRMDSKWSDQANKLLEGTVPLPLLSAIHAKPRENARKFHEWVEFSPFEASIPKYGAAISMKHLGSKFLSGLLKEEGKELALYQIMGICGSAYAVIFEEYQENCQDTSGKESRLYPKATDETKTNTSYHKKEISTDLRTDELQVEHWTDIAIETNRENNECNTDKTNPSICNRNDSTNGFDEVDGPSNYSNRKDSRLVDECPGSYDICNLLDDPQMDHTSWNNSHKYDEIDEILNFKSYLTEQDESNQPTDEDMEDLQNMFSRICEIPNELNGVFLRENSCEEAGNDGNDQVDGMLSDYFQKLKASDWFQKVQAYFLKDRDTFQRTACINNFMRKVSFDEFDGNPQRPTLFENYLKNEDLEELRLIDAGLAFNSPYPLLFRSGRDIDLILSFDFTDRKADNNSPFKTLLEAEEWARTHEIKFPKIKDTINQYRGQDIQELYVFEETDLECPIIMHFVLVNNDFRHYSKPNVPRKYDENEKKFANFNIYDQPSDFHCMKFDYSNENFDRIAQLSEFIVLNNQKEIEKYIQKSIFRKSQIAVEKTGSRHPTCEGRKDKTV